MAMVHLSQLCAEIVLWSSEEFGFIRLDDAWCTGSSIMPQKRNPDAAELIRGKSGRVIGDLVSLLSVLKGLTLAYNKDLQEDKEALFDATDALAGCLEAAVGMLAGASFDRERMARGLEKGLIAATEVADYLVRQGVPFREAHAVVGRIVAACEERGVGFEDLSLDEWTSFSSKFADDIGEYITPAGAAHAKCSPGGTSPESVREQIQLGRELLGS
jgi:argininosuccinate lyase